MRHFVFDLRAAGFKFPFHFWASTTTYLRKKKSQQLPLWGVTLKATTRRCQVAKSHLAKELPQDEKPTDVASAGDAQQEVSSPAKELPQDEKPTEVASAGDAQQSIPSSNHIPFPET